MEKNTYSNTLKNFSIIDNNLAASQLTIGESSNLAQICLSYSYNFEDKKYQDYVCILSVLAQVAIDNAKRRFDIDLSSEISRIKKDMEVDKYKYPLFWQGIRKNFNKERINSELKCPMNSLYNVDINKFRDKNSTLPIGDFFIKHEFDKKDRRKSKKVEELIQKYSLDLYSKYQNPDTEYSDDDNENYILLRNDFDELINDIRITHISKNYISLMSWLINRAFCIGPEMKANISSLKSNTNNNRSLLMKTLYEVNKDAFLKCFKSV